MIRYEGIPSQSMYEALKVYINIVVPERNVEVVIDAERQLFITKTEACTIIRIIKEQRKSNQ